MPEEMESPTEQSQEDIHHHATHSPEKWIGWVALTVAFLAALAAITGLKAGDHVNEALFKQMQATDKWNEYQGQKLKATIKIEVLAGLGKPISEADQAKLEEREKKQEVLKEKATEYQEEAVIHMERHKKLAPGVTRTWVVIAKAVDQTVPQRSELDNTTAYGNWSRMRCVPPLAGITPPIRAVNQRHPAD